MHADERTNWWTDRPSNLLIGRNYSTYVCISKTFADCIPCHEDGSTDIKDFTKQVMSYNDELMNITLYI